MKKRWIDSNFDEFLAKEGINFSMEEIIRNAIEISENVKVLKFYEIMQRDDETNEEYKKRILEYMRCKNENN